MKLFPWLQIILLGAFGIASVHSFENENHGAFIQQLLWNFIAKMKFDSLKSKTKHNSELQIRGDIEDNSKIIFLISQ